MQVHQFKLVMEERKQQVALVEIVDLLVREELAITMELLVIHIFPVVVVVAGMDGGSGYTGGSGGGATGGRRFRLCINFKFF